MNRHSDYPKVKQSRTPNEETTPYEPTGKPSDRVGSSGCLHPEQTEVKYIKQIVYIYPPELDFVARNACIGTQFDSREAPSPITSSYIFRAEQQQFVPKRIESIKKEYYYNLFE